MTSFAYLMITTLTKNNNILVWRSLAPLPRKLWKIDYPLIFHWISIDPCLKGQLSCRTTFFRKNIANVFRIVIPSRNISSAIYLAQKSRFKVLNLPLTRTSAINASILPITWRDVTGVEQQMVSNMADCCSSSDSATSLSDYYRGLAEGWHRS